MKLNPFTLVFVFVVSFICFLLGWLFAVYVLPGQKLQYLAKIKQNTLLDKASDIKSQSISNTEATLSTEPSAGSTNQPVLEEIKNNVLFLFDPYQMDSLIKKNTALEKKSSFIKHTADFITVKKKPTVSIPTSPKIDLKSFEEEKQLSEEFSSASMSLLKEINPELKALQESYDKKNKEQLLIIEAGQKFFKSNGKFSFMVNVFSSQDKTFKYVNQMKKQYPLWSFLIKAYRDHIRVYVGPFPSKELAQEFKKTLPNPSPFSSLNFLEEVSL